MALQGYTDASGPTRALLLQQKQHGFSPVSNALNALNAPHAQGAPLGAEAAADSSVMLPDGEAAFEIRESRDGHGAPVAHHHHIVWMLLSEFLCVFIYGFVTILSASLSLSAIYQAFAQAAAIVFVMTIGLEHSGAHLSPFVTGLYMLLQKFSILRGLAYILLIHPAAYELATVVAIAISPAPALAAVPLSAGGALRVGAFEAIGSGIVAVSIVWAAIAPEMKKAYPQPLPNHGATSAPTPVPVLVGLAYLAGAIPGMFISGSVYNFYRYLFTALHAGVVTPSLLAAYSVGPLLSMVVVAGAHFLFALYAASVHSKTK